ncbi:hypothetical protein ME3_01084 [Bartonella melophagi K-2C]|uniref:Flagellar biosynthetic protein FliQ n=1 Tax=Bartonella melophagi K-2C TaxID=1094557 RepID=J1JUC2_9HYPH|nr:hypothetical protein ME3_01084 [Bartonella melophagi K-2C]
MNEADAIDMVTAAIWTILIASTPALLAAMSIGIFIALFQALTQVQEMILTFFSVNSSICRRADLCVHTIGL